MIEEDRSSTKEQILAKLHQRKDFPAMSNTIKIINEFEDGGRHPCF